MAKNVDVVVIGGGQTGLTAGYYLRKAQREFVILDAHERVGDAWRKRWDSLVLFTPDGLSHLPGRRMPPCKDGFPSKDDMADYLEDYARGQRLPVRSGTRVTAVRRADDGLVVETDQGVWQARNVIVAMSDFQQPWRPGIADALDPKIVQLHSKDYRNASQLAAGPVLIVGAANSGVDIAMDVAQTHQTILAGDHPAVVPIRIESWLARNVVLRLARFLGHHLLTRRLRLGRRILDAMAHRGGIVVRVKPKDLEKAGVGRVGRIETHQGGMPATGGQVLEVANVIWATGFRPDWSWIDAPGRDAHGRPCNHRGVVDGVPGLYMVGQDFLFAATSASVSGHQRDVRYVVRHLLARD